MISFHAGDHGRPVAGRVRNAVVHHGDPAVRCVDNLVVGVQEGIKLLDDYMRSEIRR